MKQSLYIELRKNNKLEEIAFEYYKEKKYKGKNSWRRKYN